MHIESNDQIKHQTSYKSKTPLFLTCSILSVLVGALSFLSNEGIKTQIFIIILFFICICITFNFLKKRNGYTSKHGYLFWKISGTVLISLIVYTLLKNSEETTPEKNKGISNTINNSFDKNNFRDLHIHNHISQQEYWETVPLPSPPIDGNTFGISTPAEKKSTKNTRPIHIEDAPELPIMEVPKDAGDKKIIKPVLHFPT